MRKARANAGSTLIEVMLASVILAIIALAGAAFVYRSRADIALQKNRRVAIELANARMEELMYDTPYADVVDMVASSPHDETEAINGLGNYRRRTVVTGPDATQDDCLHIVVTMQYNPLDPADLVTLETLRGR